MRLTQAHIFLCLGLIFICSFEAVLSGRSPSSTDENRENRDSRSLLDDDDEDESDSPSETKPKNTNSTEFNFKRKSMRHITLPEDYDKLQIPSIGNVKRAVYIKFFGFDPSWDTGDSERVKDNVQDSQLILGVGVDAQIRSVRDIDEIKEEITIELDFITTWIDWIIAFEQKDNPLLHDSISTAALQKDSRIIDPVFLKRVWKPDLFIENVISIVRPELISKPIRLLFNPAGGFMVSTRVAVKMDCDMDFYYYPADTQSCVFRIRSYSYSMKDLNISWGWEGEAGPFLLDRDNDNFDVKLDMMDPLDLEGSDGLFDSSYSETFRVLQFKISARRKLSYHLIQTYLPSAFFIIITWLAFLVPPTMVEARIGISMTTLLTLTSMFASVRESTPSVSYVKAIDTWMVTCIFFVFLTLLEFTVLTWRRHLKTSILLVHENDEGGQRKAQGKGQQYDLVGTNDPKGENIEIGRMSRISRQPSKTDLIVAGFSEVQIEQYGSMIYSLLFIMFNIIYWAWLLIASEYFNWEVDLAYNVKD